MSQDDDEGAAQDDDEGAAPADDDLNDPDYIYRSRA